MTSVPAYTNTCIARGPSSTSVYLIGVPATNEGKLEVYTVDLSNINSPVATFKSSQTNAFWISGAVKACYGFENDSDPNSPIILQQFEPKSYFVNVFPNGTIAPPGYFKNTDFVSPNGTNAPPGNTKNTDFVTPKLCSVTGSSENMTWFTAYVNASSTTTKSSWTGMRLHATNPSENSLSYQISEYPTSTPLLSVGTYVTSSKTESHGYHTVFDTNGGGMVYAAQDSSAPIPSSNYSTVSLSSPQQVNMNGIVLTSSAIAITMDNVAYILDQAPDVSILLYSINPSQSTNLLRVSVSGNVPMFSSFMTATALSGNIVLYSLAGGVATFNIFNTTALAWSGPNLMMAANPPSPTSTPSPPSPSSLSPTSCPGSGCPTSTSSSSTAAIIGAVIGGLALLAILAIGAFFLIRYRRNSKRAPGAVSASSTETESQHMGTVAPMQENSALKRLSTQLPQYPQQHQSPTQLQQWQVFDPYHSLNPQERSLSEGSTSPILYPVQQQQQPSPPIFWSPQGGATSQAQPQPFMYFPPTVGTFAPQPTDTRINASYSQPVYTQEVGATTPPNLYIPVSQIHTGSQQDVQPGQGNV